MADRNAQVVEMMDRILEFLHGPESPDGDCMLKVAALAVTSGVMIDHLLRHHLAEKDKPRIEELRAQLYATFGRDVRRGMSLVDQTGVDPFESPSEDNFPHFDSKGVFH